MQAKKYESPSLAVDIVIYRFVEDSDDIEFVVIERLNDPKGTAFPGGFVDVGESCEAAAVREAKEETSLDVTLADLVGVFSDPKRDPRQHVVSVVYTAYLADDSPVLSAQDDAKSARWVRLSEARNLNWVFDHKKILEAAVCHAI